jgi:two-component system chemotaxis sensor kinase CheA
LALDGQEAFNVLMTSELPDLVISDIQMPRMDGFMLAERIKKEPRTANLPVILVTSLDSAEDKAKGVDAGADAYIVKRSFDQNNLLETITQLI